MFIKKPFILILLGITVLLQSCISHESLMNYHTGEQLTINQPIPITNPKNIHIQVNDVLDIKVHSQDLVTAAPFNLIPSSGSNNFNNPNLYQLQGYLVDENGSIDFPVLGKVTVIGLTKEETKTLLVDSLKVYLKNPVVNIRFLNFKITVSGEVFQPGAFQIYNERITLSEVITMAGDLTPYADRKNILIVREIDNKRTFGRVDMSASNFFASEYYFLQQNDFIYIEPVAAKRGAVNDNSNKILPFVSAVVSIAALLISAFK